ncbi:hypothetical protein F2Q70_00012744 [Brassica cretica]|uniref:Uncharacterized protein n=1 Tax=Brassica cretica TaxID=69181 RepID=A0A8S9M8P4_BRACR|nr:hypothetical protein F2Q70_00012744 [Brassica cretica]
MAARIHGGAGAGAATALSTFNPKKLVAPSRTNLPGTNHNQEKHSAFSGLEKLHEEINSIVLYVLLQFATTPSPRFVTSTFRLR